MKPIFITGRSGNVTQHLTQRLLAAGIPIRVGARSQPKNPGDVHFDFLKPDTFTPAVSGCSRVFIIRPPDIANTKQTLNVFIEQAYKAGVEHIVFVSVAGAESNSFVPHYAVEQKLIHSGHNYTILRPGFFAQNLEGPYLDDIKTDDRLYLPAGYGLVNFIDARDIAKVAAMALLDPIKHRNQAYTLAGNEAVSFDQVAQILTAQLGRKINYKPASVLGYMWHLKKQKLPTMQIVIQTILHFGIRRGQAHIVDSTLEQLIEGKPISIKDYIKDYHAIWHK